jgi:hypothetical protein
VVIGKEVGENGTPHLQGFMQFPERKSLRQMKKLCDKSHFEKTKGSIDQNYAYCTKDGNFEERGTRPMSQKRKGESEQDRYEEARRAAKEGRFDDIPADIYIRHLGNIKKIYAESQGAPVVLDGELQNEWIYGPAGAGKSSQVFQRYPGERLYVKDLNQWWDGYVNQEVVLIDDMDPFHRKLAREFKIWGDRYSFPAQTKGGTIVIRPRKIIVTSQYPIDEIWLDDTTRAAIHRRFEEIYCPPNSWAEETVEGILEKRDALSQASHLPQETVPGQTYGQADPEEDDSD